MRFEDPLLEAKLIRRYKRFLADVKLRTGEEITVHCANPGGMLGISDPGSKVLLSATNDPRRKFDHQLEIIYSGSNARREFIPVGQLPWSQKPSWRDKFQNLPVMPP